MATDPVCQMTVDPSKALRAEQDGRTYYFCSEHCRREFLDAPSGPPAPSPTTARYVCPMHPEVHEDRPGPCPKCGMAMEPREGASAAEEDDPELRDMARRLLVAMVLGVPLLVLGMSPMAGFPVTDWLGAGFGWLQLALASPVVLWAGWPFFERAARSIALRHLNMFTLIGMGTGTAYLYSLVAVLAPGAFPESVREHGHVGLYFEAAAGITILVLLGQVLELRARRRTRDAIRALLALTPPTARRVCREEVQIVALAEVQPGDTLQVAPGDRVPVDGTVLEGHGTVDESMITGESMAVEKSAGAGVIGGTVNRAGSLRMRAERVGSDTMLARIVQLVAEAQRSRAPIQRLADAVAAWFVPAVFLVALVTFAVWMLVGPEPRLTHALVSTVAVLIIACPCALGLATPMSIMVGIGRGAREGVLVKNAEVLEVLQKADTVVVDKTGTLTEGRPSLTECAAAVAFSENDVLQWAASVESRSEHPLAQAIVEAARGRGLPILPVEDFRSVAGSGVEGTVGGRRIVVGNPALLKERRVEMAPLLEERAVQLRRNARTTLLVAVGDRHAGLLAVADRIKDSTPEAVRMLHRLGLRILMLTGDNEATARAVARDLALDQFEAEVKPQDKYERVRALRAASHVVAMAGDGINDAPALAEADVGIAMGTGSDIAIETSDVTLLRGDLRGIARAFRLSRRTMRNIRQNLLFAFVYNLVGVPVAAGVLYPAFGLLLSPVIAAAAMSFSSLSVVANALRLRTVRL